jgi:hypothetical protein
LLPFLGGVKATVELVVVELGGGGLFRSVGEVVPDVVVVVVAARVYQVDKELGV